MAGASGGDLDNAIGIEGDSDHTRIGNVNDRLKVDFSAGPSGNEPIIPADEIRYIYDFLKNGSSTDLTINGSSTPVVFSAGPPADENWFITEVLIVIQDGGNLNVGDYGSGVALTNGLLFEQTRDSVDLQIANLTTNLELAMLFSEASLQGKSQGFLNDANIFIGAFRVEPEISLLGATSDVMKVTVRDNLTGLSNHQVAFRAWNII